MKKLILFPLIAGASLFGLEISQDCSRYTQEPFRYEDDVSNIFELPLTHCNFSNFFEIQKLAPLSAQFYDISFFKLSSFLLQPNHSYLLILCQAGESVHMRSFKVEGNGKFISCAGEEREVKIRIDGICEGEILELSLYDIEDKTYFESSITLFPKAYSLGEEGSVQFSTKFPLPFIGIEFSGMFPSEEVEVLGANGDREVFSMDENGYCKNDLHLERWANTDPLQLQISCSNGDFVCPLISTRNDWSSMPKHNAIVILQPNLEH